MNKSATIENLAKALIKAQAEFPEDAREARLYEQSKRRGKALSSKDG